ncbi:MAG: NAD(P)/FAD-dependent oxidoreductase [Oscillospiraceae bacterium]
MIVGGGVIGCTIARELSRYNLCTALLERDEDVAMGTTKANSAIVHAGYDAKPGTMKARMNIAGNPLFDHLSEELDFPFHRNGSLVLCFDEAQLPELEELLLRGRQNGVQGLRILSRQELVELEPHVGKKAVAALFAPTGGIVCPYEMTIAMAENACTNGVEFLLGHEVTGLEKTGSGFVVKTPKCDFETKVLINAAGVYADKLHNMLSGDKIEIIPRSGQYCVFDKRVGSLVAHTMFQLPNVMGKGVLVTPSVDGNLLVGPTATDIGDKEDTDTTTEGFEQIIRAAGLSIEQIPMGAMINSFTGLRAHSTGDDFIIGQVPDVPGMIDVAGIESPGLTSAPAIGSYVAELVGELLPLEANPGFQLTRKGVPRFREMNTVERQALIDRDSNYGKVLCRCETVTLGEVLDSIRRPLGARDLDAVKRRTRAGMGRCQSGFCSPLVLHVLAEEWGVDPTEITKFGRGSQILVGKTREEGCCCGE